MDNPIIIHKAEKYISSDGTTKYGVSVYVKDDKLYENMYSWLTDTCDNLFVTSRMDEYNNKQSFFTSRMDEYNNKQSFFIIWFDELKYRDLFLLRWT